jgi:hypothetical protein
MNTAMERKQTLAPKVKDEDKAKPTGTSEEVLMKRAKTMYDKIWQAMLHMEEEYQLDNGRRRMLGHELSIYVAAQQNLEVIASGKLPLSRPPANDRNRDKRTFLHIAASCVRLDLVKLLVRWGASMYYTHSFFTYLLIYQLLLTIHIIDVNAQSATGDTPLHAAVCLTPLLFGTIDAMHIHNICVSNPSVRSSVNQMQRQLFPICLITVLIIPSRTM